MTEEKHIKIDNSKIQKAIQSCIPLSITTYTLPHNMEIYMSDVLAVFLKELNQAQMTEYLTYSLNELVTNAKKANTKRVYFKERHLDISDPDDYKVGMKTFKSDTLDNINHYLELQKKSGLYVKLVMQAQRNRIKIEVKNNSELLPFEYKRIHDKLARAQQYSSVEEAFAQILDDTEGAGLGLIIMMLMFKKIGLNEDCYQILCENGETISRIILPLNTILQENLNSLSKQLVDLIDTLPQFSDNIMHINSLLGDKDVDVAEIATEINKDVSLTADLLKLANSAHFSASKRFHNVKDAIVHVGMRELRNLLLSVGAMKSLGGKTENEKQLWDHAYKVAIYSYNIAKHYFRTDKLVVEDSYVCGLLHDMGKIAYNAAFPKIKDKFAETLKEKGISNEFFEQMTAGSNHAEIGALIAEKWNLPTEIVETIRFHHTPESAPTEVKKLATVVYFANMLCNYQEGEVEFYQFDPNVLAVFNVSEEEHLKALIDKFEEFFAEK